MTIVPGYVVEGMLAEISNFLIEGWQPELRLVAVVQQFLARPTIKVVVKTFVSRQDELKVM